MHNAIDPRHLSAAERLDEIADIPLRSLPPPRRSTSPTAAAFCDLPCSLQPSSRRFSMGGSHLDCSFGCCWIHFHQIGLPKHTISHKEAARG